MRVRSACPGVTPRRTGPMAASRDSRLTPPGRSKNGVGPLKSSTVDSTPTLHAPESIIAAIRPPRPASTCAALVGLTPPERLADGAATGRPSAAIKRCATGCAGTRTAKVSNPAPASNATGQVMRRGSTRVSGPGQNVSASRCAMALASTCANTASALS